MELPRFLDLPKQVVQQVMDDNVPELAAGLAYRFLFAVFPFGIFLAALAAFVAQWTGLGDPTDEILSAIGDNLPRDVAAQLAPQLETVLGQARPALLSIGALTALWAATGGISSLMGAMNTAYDVEETRGFVGKLVRALLLTLVGSLGILVAFVTIVGGSVLTEQAVSVLGIGPGAWAAISLLRYPLVLVMVAVAVAALFRFGPNVAVSFRWTAVGGLVFAVGWLIATAIFGLYVANFGSYANTYGALGGVIVLMLWFYITAMLLLVAAEVTAVLAKQHEPHVVNARRAETGAAGSAKAGRSDERSGGASPTGAPTREGDPAPMPEATPDAPRTPVPGAAAPGFAAASTPRPEPAPDRSSLPASDAPAPGFAAASTPRPEPAPGPRPRLTHRRPMSWAARALALGLVAASAIMGAIAGRVVGDDEVSRP
ncbi:MAG TPA: YhjD/YihY/BrkB family envelope integrity protein [Candidatus Limnocylindrales bacterium]|nr:YhjD/YihY/BrkB family envelope integrity protein [Candidatus Limnocylindrales bacterium]